MKLSAPMLASLLSIPVAASAQENKDVEAFFKGKTIRIVVSADAGGNYDTYSRLIARHLGRFLPGAPKFYVSNMAGAGGVVAANWLYHIAPKDGTVVGQIQRQVPLMQILGEQGPRFETAKFNWLGSMANETTICISSRDNPVKTFDDLKKQELIVASSGPNTSKNIPILLNNLLGAKFKIVSGYPSQAATALAVERGEAGGLCTSYSSLSLSYAKWFRGPEKANILVQGGLRRHPDMPDTPLAMEIATKVEDKGVIELFDTPSYAGYPYLLPPDVPAERVKAFRLAFDRMVKDKDFAAENAKEARQLDYVDGDEMQKLYERLAQAPKVMIDRVNEALK